MKYLFTLMILFNISAISYSKQVGDAKISYKDSIELSKVWTHFKSALDYRNIKILKRLSHKDVVGRYLLEPMSLKEYKAYMPIDSFLNKFFNQIPKTSRLWSVISKDKYTMIAEYSLNKRNHRMKSLIQYQIWFTKKPVNPQNEFEGLQIAFLFNKVNNQFRFCGLTSVP